VISLPHGLELPDSPTSEDVGGVLASIPGLRWDRAAWVDLLACPKDVQLRNLTVLAASSEAPGADWAAKVLDVLKVIVVVAGGISGVAGAIAGVQSIKW
jgi:hypothetical protein